ncbi:Putative aliphatic sulfonates transport permease protein SsuC (plasmid) [Sulfitobacter sp. THAF37]|uniref:ABC transporter permease n=1 Tax=Sulfitobacter sp. THAF37 TaxID=2587855 RepID=UPI001268D43B|nr:ABC transporter permease [Sulfitobacter sp. THAF37]QFT60835.1 Putative aliphatic sulfonates transport permease protein SsuC [Sulfitobacter sp. THAF37]
MNRTPADIKAVSLSLVGFAALWWIAAWLGDDPAVLPDPAEVWQIFLKETASGVLPHHFTATLLRVAAAFLLALGIGIVLGIAMGANARVNRWLSTWVVLLLNIPALVVIVLCYLWIGLNEVAAITAVALNKTAMVAVSLREGMHALDPKVRDMAQVFRMAPLTRLRYIILPQLWPYFAASVRNGLAIIWKIVLVVEFLGRSNGIGFQIHLYFQLFETGYVLAYALSFVAFMLLLEVTLISTIETRATRWRLGTAARKS